MTRQPGLVSVIMPLYNGERYVTDAVKSVLDQTYRQIELVVVDDGSTDRGPELVRSFGDERVRVITQPNGGEAAARNTGLDQAKGEFIAWLDADDICLPSRIETLVGAVRSTGAGFAHSDLLLIDGDDAVLGLWQASNVTAERLLPYLLRVGTPYNNNSMLIAADALDGARFDLTVGFGTDTDFVAQFVPRTSGVHVPEPLVLYRRHGENMSGGVGVAEIERHVEHILNRYPLARFVPEAWTGRSGASAQILADCLVGLHLARRGLTQSATKWLSAANATAAGGPIEPVAAAVANLAGGNLQEAARALALAPEADPVAANYRGELATLRGDLAAAYDHFTRALSLAPKYEEPVINLTGLGGARGLNLLTPYWRRFAG